MELVKANDKKEMVANPGYDLWVAKDQQLLSYLLNSITKEVLAQVAAETTLAGAWSALQTVFAAHSRARVTNLCMRLSTLKKGSMTSSTYFTKMVAIKDEFVVVGIIIDDGEMASHIINDLDLKYNPFVSSMIGYADPPSLSELYSHSMSYELRLEAYNEGGQYSFSANSANRGGFRGCGNGGRGSGSRNRGRNNGGRDPQNHGNIGGVNQPKKTICQICKKVGHEASRCWYRYEDDDQENTKTARAAATGYGYNTNWYADNAQQIILLESLTS
ncbi:uncharacterized protein [Setaria viridis]|uniref:uncharacterized protein n=1 Tax=Setaria viridis TaxID=4556 RepID=UPI003B3B4DF7